MSEHSPPEAAGAQLGPPWPEDAAGPARPPMTPSERRHMVVWAGILAGLGFGTAIAFLMHVIEQANPNGNFGSGIGGTVALVVLLAGPATGLGLGLIAAGLISDIPRVARSVPASGPAGNAPPEAPGGGAAGS